MTEKKKQILDWCKDLSCAQGFYGRLYERLRADEAELNKLAEQNFGNIIDFVIFVES